MTQQYIVGEFSLLLAGLQQDAGKPLGEAVGRLRHDVECSPLPLLPRLTGEAMALADTICWVALEQGNVIGFRRSVDAAVALREFADSANLLPYPEARRAAPRNLASAD